MRTLPTLALLLLACDPLPMPPPADGGATDMARPSRPDVGRYGLFCYQPLGDGPSDQQAPGAACAGADACAAPVACSFESFDYASACLLGHCCQFARTHNMVTGAVENCRDCGDGWSCEF